MVEQQEDVFEQMRYFSEGLTSTSAKISGAQLAQKIEARMHNAFMIEAEVDAKYLVMTAMMGESAQLVGEGIGEPGDLDACLSGAIEDYVPSF